MFDTYLNAATPGKYLRVTVDCVDGDVVLCGGKVLVDISNQLYIKEMIRSGSRLNLIDYRVCDGIYHPEYIIYEPDYLINITQIAQCFESYATDARIALVKRLMPGENTQAINLGNFASQLLDEQIHKAAHKDYGESVRDFFKANALKLATCDIDNDFHRQAIAQKENIAYALEHMLPESVENFDINNVMVEPAFFCEMLGLQGRMDMLQLDYSLLIEQKSGKGQWPDNGNIPRHREAHYVQLLLYMAIMRYNYGADAESLNSFLLYSRYSKPLVKLGFASDIFEKAIEIRNRIVFNDLSIAEGDMSVMEGLTVESFAPAVENKLWERFSKPKLQKILNPLHSSEQSELTYYYRFMQFIALEHKHSVVGNSNKECSGLAALWHYSVAEKLEAGNIYIGLRMTVPAPEHQGSVGTIELAFENDANNDIANFRVGDSVILHSYSPDSEPDARMAPVHRCIITSIEPNKVVLSLRFAQSSALPFLKYHDNLWAIEHDYVDSSHSALYQGLHSFLTAPQNRRDLLLLRRPPEVDGEQALHNDYGDFNDLALKVKQAKDFFLIIGPPGTGKTSYGLMTTLKEELADGKSSVLLLSYTNRAVDEICSKLVEENIDFLRIGPEQSCEEAYRSHLLKNRAAECDNVAQVKSMIKNTRVFAATTSALNAGINLLRIKNFNLAIIDEASQILEPHLLGILSAKDGKDRPAIQKFVMIGDHKQLPAVVLQSASTDVNNCRQTLFERLLKQYRHNPDITYMLTKQGRMHQDICKFPSEQFYDGLLTPVPLPHQTAPTPEGRSRVRFIDIRESEGPDKVNLAEAECIASLCVEIYHSEPKFEADKTIGVIVPYRNQIAAIRQCLAAKRIADLTKITVDTVERFQGSQRDYIIYGFTVKRPYQLKFLTDSSFEEDGKIIDRKLNVAMTRAREYLILVGNKDLLKTNELFSLL